MSTGIFGQIEDDQLLTNELLSFCDFNSAVSLGRTCRRLKRCSDAALDNWADVAASRIDDESDDRTIAGGYYDDCDGVNISGELRRGWTNTFRSRGSLIEEALTNCYIYGTRGLDEESGIYDEDRARFLLRSKGTIDIVDFISDGVDPKEFDEHGWGVTIKHCDITFDEAANEIIRAMMQIKSGEVDEEEELDDSDFELLSLRHYTFCLLRKVDPACIGFSSLDTEHRAPAYGSSSNVWAMKFLLPDNKEFEFHFSHQNQEI